MTFAFSDRFADPSNIHKTGSTYRTRHVDYDSAIRFFYTLYLSLKKNSGRFKILDTGPLSKFPKRHTGRVLIVDSNTAIYFSSHIKVFFFLIRGQNIFYSDPLDILRNQYSNQQMALEKESEVHLPLHKVFLQIVFKL